MSIQAELQRVFKNLGKSLDDGFNLHPDIFVGQADFDTSTTAANLHAYLGQLPGVREWLGDRVLHELSTRMIELPNKDWELSFKMKETEMEDALGTALFERAGLLPALVVLVLIASLGGDEFKLTEVIGNMVVLAILYFSIRSCIAAYRAPRWTAAELPPNVVPAE